MSNESSVPSYLVGKIAARVEVIGRCSAQKTTTRTFYASLEALRLSLARTVIEVSLNSRLTKFKQEIRPRKIISHPVLFNIPKISRFKMEKIILCGSLKS